jgi:ABC-type glycerol-3-phosphate transport system substrate-binding protein
MARPVAARRAPATTLTVTFWTEMGDPVARSQLLPFFAAYEKSHPGITIKFEIVSQSNNFVKYSTAMAAGRGPDVVLTAGYNPPIPEWAANGLIQPLDPWFRQLNVSQNQWLPWVWQMQYFHGRIWGFVQEYDTMLLAWNKDAFKKAGLDPNKPPRTIAELDADARKLTRFDAHGNLIQAGIVPWQLGWDDPRFWPVMFGSRVYDYQKRAYTINTPANVRVMQWMASYGKLLGGPEKVSNFMKGFTGNNDPFYTGQVAMEIVGEWVPSVNWRLYAPKNLNYGVAAPPVGPGVPYGTNVVIGSDIYALPVGSPHPREAAQLMLYMESPGPVLGWCIAEANVPPTRAAVLDPSFVAKVPTDASVVETARAALKNPSVLDPFPTSAIYDYVTQQYDLAIQQVLFGRTTAAAAVASVQNLVDQREAKLKQENPDWYAAGD